MIKLWLFIKGFASELNEGEVMGAAKALYQFLKGALSPQENMPNVDPETLGRYVRRLLTRFTEPGAGDWEPEDIVEKLYQILTHWKDNGSW